MIFPSLHIEYLKLKGGRLLHIIIRQPLGAPPPWTPTKALPWTHRGFKAAPSPLPSTAPPLVQKFLDPPLNLQLNREQLGFSYQNLYFDELNFLLSLNDRGNENHVLRKSELIDNHHSCTK
jgi:hypothetical protein